MFSEQLVRNDPRAVFFGLVLAIERFDDGS